MREREALFLRDVEKLMLGSISAETVAPLDYTETPRSTASGIWGSALIHDIPYSKGQPQVKYRQVSSPNLHLYHIELIQILGRRGLSHR